MISPDASARFVYDASGHTYICATTGEQRPHITGLLKAGGLVDDQWFTELGRFRGTAIHDMALQYDLGALRPDDVTSDYKPALLAYERALQGMRPIEWTHLEEAFMHPVYRFGGRPDRVGMVRGAVSVVDLKSGVDSAATDIQLALQAILVAPVVRIPEHLIHRYVFVCRPDGRMKVEQAVNRSDFAKAHALIRRFC